VVVGANLQTAAVSRVAYGKFESAELFPTYLPLIVIESTIVVAMVEGALKAMLTFCAC
jgi:hypothetical protein